MSRTIRRMPLAILTIILTVLLLFSCLLGLKLGYLSVSLSGIVSILASHLSGSALPSDIAMGAADAVWDLRLPRILLALAVGMGLSLSGMVMQAMFRNPMSDPYIMGVSSGASLGAAAAVFFGDEDAGMRVFSGSLPSSNSVMLWVKHDEMQHPVPFSINSDLMAATFIQVSWW